MEISYTNGLLTILWGTGNIYSYADVPKEIAEQVKTSEDFFRLVAPRLNNERGIGNNCPCGLIHRYV